MGRSISRAFVGIKNKVRLKLQGWKGNMFSQGGREILLKAVALAIPSYAMSYFKIPTKLCSEITKESLFHKAYAVRYFSDGNLLIASLGGNPSYAWRGIWEAKNLLVQGGRWNVGDGSLIHILNDAWIPGFQNLRQELGDEQSMEQLCQLDNQVLSLIDPGTKWWDLAKVKALFNPNVVDVVIRLHPNHTGAID
ncbi:uncharacterized protein LOC121262056 [Juglans microcarpa x Juglans regia]|uniref:uncharacterized protein LOC121262056 n=1 Tax=Juglans microcarpa x Juglans regia TaxID=2249226 RepID=UPI001B7F0334|nr:uncharacterized protein LOC121262056 [Juglans microcarpa x Juglans regia]